ncbi:MAG: hypothetical protein HY587_04560 [Candidatus Omnitrophica bacterium]|nr:hypothetical protein [Candidatus Omnitrophota bacterium]
MGVMGVFAIFRIDTNERSIRQLYEEAATWIGWRKNIDGARWIPRNEIRKILEEAKEDAATKLAEYKKNNIAPSIPIEPNYKKVVNMIQNIDSAEKRQSDAQNHLRPILFYWAYLFGSSLLFLALAKYLADLPWVWLPGILVLFVLLITAKALSLSGPYINACLQKTEG